MFPHLPIHPSTLPPRLPSSLSCVLYTRTHFLALRFAFPLVYCDKNKIFSTPLNHTLNAQRTATTMSSPIHEYNTRFKAKLMRTRKASVESEAIKIPDQLAPERPPRGLKKGIPPMNRVSK